MKKLFQKPGRDYLILVLVSLSLAVGLVTSAVYWPLFVISGLGAAPVVVEALRSLFRLRISIDVFNLFALSVAFASGDPRSAAFIVLMLASASALDYHTETRARRAVEKILALKPVKAIVEKGGKLEEVSSDKVKKGDLLVVETGAAVPVDGKVVFGSSFVSEALVTGESTPVEKNVGDHVFGSTINESGVIRIIATKVGKESTVERMAALIREAAANKSKPEKLADRFAVIFLPALILFGVAVYLITKNLSMTAALFLVACADDMAVAIPLAVVAAIGRAARRGVIIKGGASLSALARVRSVVLDKTGTLTYGHFSLKSVEIESGTSAKDFWLKAGIAQKYSDHPIGRAIFKEAAKFVHAFPDPDSVSVVKGRGMKAVHKKEEILVGSEVFLRESGIKIPKATSEMLARLEAAEVVSLLAAGGRYIGSVVIADVPKPEAKASLAKLRSEGVKKIIMFTGDKEEAARYVSETIGIKEYRASMTPEDKVREVGKLAESGAVAMIGDGVNDAPALTRADVGIAMGGGGAAVAVEAADIVILTDELSRVPEMVALGRQTVSIIRWDIVIWAISNLVGFGLVLTGVAGIPLAAFYNFITDFFPILNSARLFRRS